MYEILFKILSEKKNNFKNFITICFFKKNVMYVYTILTPRIAWVYILWAMRNTEQYTHFGSVNFK